jgi:hypothetical protein
MVKKGFFTPIGQPPSETIDFTPGPTVVKERLSARLSAVESSLLANGVGLASLAVLYLNYRLLEPYLTPCMWAVLCRQLRSKYEV